MTFARLADSIAQFLDDYRLPDNNLYVSASEFFNQPVVHILYHGLDPSTAPDDYPGLMWSTDIDSAGVRARVIVDGIDYTVTLMDPHTEPAAA